MKLMPPEVDRAVDGTGQGQESLKRQGWIVSEGIVTSRASLRLGHRASDRLPAGAVKKQSLALEGRGDDEHTFVSVEFVAKYMCSVQLDM